MRSFVKSRGEVDLEWFDRELRSKGERPDCYGCLYGGEPRTPEHGFCYKYMREVNTVIEKCLSWDTVWTVRMDVCRENNSYRFRPKCSRCYLAGCSASCEVYREGWRENGGFSPSSDNSTLLFQCYCGPKNSPVYLSLGVTEVTDDEIRVLLRGMDLNGPTFCRKCGKAQNLNDWKPLQFTYLPQVRPDDLKLYNQEYERRRALREQGRVYLSSLECDISDPCNNLKAYTESARVMKEKEEK